MITQEKEEFGLVVEEIFHFTLLPFLARSWPVLEQFMIQDSLERKRSQLVIRRV